MHHLCVLGNTGTVTKSYSRFDIQGMKHSSSSASSGFYSMSQNTNDLSQTDSMDADGKVSDFVAT